MQLRGAAAHHRTKQTQRCNYVCLLLHSKEHNFFTTALSRSSLGWYCLLPNVLSCKNKVKWLQITMQYVWEKATGKLSEDARNSPVLTSIYEYNIQKVFYCHKYALLTGLNTRWGCMSELASVWGGGVLMMKCNVEILRHTLLLFLYEIYLEDHRFMPDNDSKHNSNMVMLNKASLQTWWFCWQH